MIIAFVLSSVLLGTKFDLKYTLIYLVGLVVPFLSHVWHIIYGEDSVANYCEDEWVHCVDVAGFYVLFFDSYEVTVVLEVWICHGLLFWFRTPELVRYLAIVALILTVPLPIVDLNVYARCAI